MTQTTTIGIIAIVLIALAAVPAMATSADDGYIYVFDICRNNVYSNAITIQPVESNAAIPFTNGAKVTKEFVDLFNPSGNAIDATLGGSGNYDTPLAPGTYAVTLHYGQAGLPEYAMVKIVAGQRTDVMFLGTALSNGAAKTGIVILTASYGDVDVTALVQDAVNRGHTQMVFDNSPNPGGLFAADGVTLLAQIPDPAYGIVKTAVITYSINGQTLVVTGPERTVLTI